MPNDIVTTSTIESVVIGGDLSRLSPEQRVSYYQATCKSLGLNPLTRPFDYITLNGKLTLYARKDAADQLRKINSISIDKPDIQFQDDWIIVSVVAHDASGRKDSDLGVVSRKDMRGDFGNALMKAVTKAKRRVTLSICGLGMLDETEIESIPDARPVVVADTGEIVQPAQIQPPTKNIDYESLGAVVCLTTNRDGTPYIELPTDKLAIMANSLRKSLANNHLGDEEKALQMDKLAAAEAILKLRSES